MVNFPSTTSSGKIPKGPTHKNTKTPSKNPRYSFPLKKIKRTKKNYRLRKNNRTSIHRHSLPRPSKKILRKRRKTNNSLSIRDSNMEQKKLIKKLEEFKKSIEKKYKLQTMLLFGSRAKRPEGKYKFDDVDLILVGDFKGKNSSERSSALYLKWKIDLPVDFICYTSQEFEKLKNKISIVTEALAHGIFIN